MHYLLYIFGILVTLSSKCGGVKINMHGSVSLGKEVVNAITNYINKGYLQSRRSMQYEKEPDRMTLLVKSMYLCRGLEICEGKFSFVNEYVVMLANAVESIFDGILNPNPNDDNRALRISRGAIFEEPLKHILQVFKKLLRHADAKVNDDNEAYVWINLIKKVSAKFQDAALLFVNQRLEGDPKDMKEVKKKLTQKLVIAIIIVESKYEGKLCMEYNLCEKNLECTNSLNKFLEIFKKVSDDKTRMFMKYFLESIPEGLFSFLNDDTANEFQIILSDMVYSENVPTRDILLMVQKSVIARLNIIKSNTDLKKAYDILLVNVILSDLDHFYHSNYRVYNFDNFLGRFTQWTTSGGRLHTELTQAMKDIKKRLLDQPKDLLMKLTNEIKVFLELTVDPEK